MSQPLYFLPGVRRGDLASIPLARSLFTERALLDVFADVPLDADHLAINELAGRGPGDLAGTIVCYQTPKGGLPQRTEYKAAEQEWTAIGDGKLIWIGIDRASPPTEADLVRRRQYGGYRVILSDDGRWLVPTIRLADGGSELPTDMLWDAAGVFREPLKPAYAQQWNDSAEVATWFFGSSEGESFGGPTFTPARALELAVAALSLNYRFGRREQSLLRLIDKTNYLAVLGATVDAPLIAERVAKKKAPEHARRAVGRIERCTDERQHDVNAYLTWIRGRLPNYRPSRGELYLAALGYGTPPRPAPVNHNYYILRR